MWWIGECETMNLSTCPFSPRGCKLQRAVKLFEDQSRVQTDFAQFTIGTLAMLPASFNCQFPCVGGSSGLLVALKIGTDANLHYQPRPIVWTARM